MENKYKDMAWDVNDNWATDHNDSITYAGTYRTACGYDARWALVSTYCDWQLVDGIDVDFTIVDDEEQGRLGVIDYYGSCGFDTLLEASLYIRQFIDSKFVPDCEELLNELEYEYDDVPDSIDPDSVLEAAEAGVPMEDILA